MMVANEQQTGGKLQFSGCFRLSVGALFFIVCYIQCHVGVLWSHLSPFMSLISKQIYFRHNNNNLTYTVRKTGS